MNRDYLLALIAGFFTGIFILPIFKNLAVEVPGAPMVFLIGIPILWILGLKIAKLMARRFAWVYQFAKFVVSGFLNTAIAFGILNLGSYLTGIYSGTGIIFLNILAFSVAVINSFFWNKYWTFKSETKINIKEFAKFATVPAIGTVIDTSIIFSITTFYAGLDNFSPAQLENIAKVIATAVALVWNFIGMKFLVFKK